MIRPVPSAPTLPPPQIKRATLPPAIATTTATSTKSRLLGPRSKPGSTLTTARLSIPSPLLEESPTFRSTDASPTTPRPGNGNGANGWAGARGLVGLVGIGSASGSEVEMDPEDMWRYSAYAGSTGSEKERERDADDEDELDGYGDLLSAYEASQGL
jgi:hypothetical protein